jgi:hypothetical protein
MIEYVYTVELAAAGCGRGRAREPPVAKLARDSSVRSRGFLVLEGVVPEAVNARVLEVLRERTEKKDHDAPHPLVVNVEHYPWKALLSECFGREPHIGDVLCYRPYGG